MGYISRDGHMFTCTNPVVLQQAFHVYAGFYLSMSHADRDNCIGSSLLTGA
jgi:hypothetical protein